MPNAAVDQAMAQIRTSLLTRVNGVSPYVYDLVTVHRQRTIIEKIGALPAAVMEEGEDEPSGWSTGAMYLDRMLTVEAWIRNDPDLDEATQVNNLWADILRAMSAGSNEYHTLADGTQTCLQTIYVGSDRLVQADIPLLWVTMRFRVRIAISRTEPTAFGPV